MIQCRDDEFINPINKGLAISVRSLNTKHKFKEEKDHCTLSREHTDANHASLSL